MPAWNRPPFVANLSRVNESFDPPAPLKPGLKSLWLVDEKVAFLNHGSFGALPQCVFDQQTEWRRRIEAEPVELISRQRLNRLAEAKAPIASWLKMRVEDFGFVTNATEGINCVLRSLTYRSGDELLTTTHVYGAVRKAMQFVSDQTGARYREIDLQLPIASPEQVVDRVIASLSDRTRLLVIDHVTSSTALIFPLVPIIAECTRRGIEVLVDGAHAPGMIPLDVPAIGAKYYAGNLHKWAAAPKGTGFIWVHPDRQADIHPLVVSHHYREGFVLEFGWQGTRDLAAWLSAPCGFEFMTNLGWEKVMRHNHQMAVWAQAMLCKRWGVEPISPIDGSMLGSMATVRLPGRLAGLSEPDAMALQQRFYTEFKVEVPIMQWGGKCFVRPCCQVYNEPHDYERLADMVLKLV
jgi:isopenicillin-N epimerase